MASCFTELKQKLLSIFRYDDHSPGNHCFCYKFEYRSPIVVSVPTPSIAAVAAFLTATSYVWMYMIPLGLIVMNAVTQAMNVPEEQPADQSAAQAPQPTAQRAPNSSARRR
ncbi:hypothetical protein KSP40_PGU017507 [Platanthera guangdongensis]|uniref:Uncharacterized protein n=1 Tax=Platanthera guangdongensis TaxID=2320717 RepID=A0ABR2M4B6_9ASPA